MAERRTAKPKTFEQMLARLDEIVRSLEKGDAPLEESLSLYTEGAELIARLVPVPFRIVERGLLADEVAAMPTDVVISFGAGNIDACCEALAEKLGAKS